MANDKVARLIADASRPVTVDSAGLEATLAAWEEQDSSTAVKVLSGIGGFFASLLFLIVIWATSLFDDPVFTSVCGASLVLITIMIGRHRRQAFLASLTICGYLVGAGMVLWAIPYGTPDYYPVVFTLIIAALTLLFTRNYFLVVVATLSVVGCLLYLYLLEYGHWSVDLAVIGSASILLLLSFFEYRLITDRRYSALRTGVVLGLFMAMVHYCWMPRLMPRTAEGLGDWPVAAVLYALTLVAVLIGLGRKWVLGLGLVTLPLVFLPLLLGSLLTLLLSFRNRHFIGIGTGVLGLVYFTSQYYYDLRWSLLDKSLVLMASGLLLLLGYFLFQRKFRPGEAS